MSSPVESLIPPSERAFQDAQLLCLRANDQMQDSARVAVDVVALHAKVRWMVDGVLEQFKVSS